MEKNSSWPSDCVWPAPICTKDKKTHNPHTPQNPESFENFENFKPENFKPEQFEHDGQYMLKVLSYFNDLVYEGLLDEDYAITSSKQWEPEIGGEWWEGDYFDFEAWQRSFSILVNALKLPQPNPVRSIETVIGYTFVNENLLRQAFTRHAFAVEYNNTTHSSASQPEEVETKQHSEISTKQHSGERTKGAEDGQGLRLGDNEQLEFIGDTVLNTIVTQEIIRKLTEVHKYNCFAPFQSVRPEDTTDPKAPNDVVILPPMSLYGSSVRQTMQTIQKGQLKHLGKGIELEARKLGESGKLGEGEFTKIRAKFVSKEYLSAQVSALGLDKFILYGSGEEVSDSAKEDVIEALIGAVAVDSGWNWTVLNTVVDNLINFSLEKIDLEKNYYDKFNEWHQKRWGCMPKYEIYFCERHEAHHESHESHESHEAHHKAREELYEHNHYTCDLTYFTLNYNGRSEEEIWSRGKTRSEVREKAAETAYKKLEKAGLMVKDIKRDSGIEPNLERSINQLQELRQKKYLREVEYYFFTDNFAGVFGTDDSAGDNICSCYCGQPFNRVCGFGKDRSKRKAKKLAAFNALNILLAQTSPTPSVSSVPSAPSTSPTPAATSTPVGTSNTSRASITKKAQKNAQRNAQSPGRNTEYNALNEDSENGNSGEWLKLLIYPKGWNNDDVYRVLQVPTAFTLDDLCSVILQTFNFTDDHLYTFTVGGEIYLCKDADLDRPWTTGIELGKLILKTGDCMILLYDFSDNWRFVISVLPDKAYATRTPQTVQHTTHHAVQTTHTTHTRRNKSSTQGNRRKNGSSSNIALLLGGKGELEQYS